MFALMETFGINGKSKPLLTADTLDSAMEAADALLSIVMMEKDSDGHEAADIYTKSGGLYVIEKV